MVLLITYDKEVIMEKMHILCDSHHGVYLPHIWVKNTENIWGIDQEDWDYLSEDDSVDKEYYWETWETILNNAKYIDSDGVVWTLYLDGDLFAIAYDEMTEEELNNLDM